MSSFLARRREAKESEKARAAWQARNGFLRAAIAAITQLQTAPATAGTGVALRSNEGVLWSAPAQLIEPRRTPGHYAGRSSGVSVRVAKGVYYRVGASRGNYQPGAEVQSPTDAGQVVVTNQRVVFVGHRTVREWAFSRLVSMSADPTGALVMLAVSNRQKISGVRAPGADLWIELAARISEAGPTTVLQNLRTEMAATPQPQPAQLQTAAADALAAPGWYAAEGDTPGQVRWWDGHAWTTNVRVTGNEAPTL